MKPRISFLPRPGVVEEIDHLLSGQEYQTMHHLGVPWIEYIECSPCFLVSGWSKSVWPKKNMCKKLPWKLHVHLGVFFVVHICRYHQCQFQRMFLRCHTGNGAWAALHKPRFWGHFFLDWYSGALKRHATDVMSLAQKTFKQKVPKLIAHTGCAFKTVILGCQ